jgi:hypothetical protein
MATHNSTNLLESPQGTFSMVPSPKFKDPRHALAAEMFKASLELARVTLNDDGWYCASCKATCAKSTKLTHSPDGHAERVTAAWEAIKQQISLLSSAA